MFENCKGTPMAKVIYGLNHYITTGDNLGEGFALGFGGDVLFNVPVNPTCPTDTADWEKLASRLGEITFPKIKQANQGLVAGFRQQMITIAKKDCMAFADALIERPGPLGWGSVKKLIDLHGLAPYGFKQGATSEPRKPGEASDPRPQRHLNSVAKLFPNAWRQVEIYLTEKGKTIPDWPLWCFLPSEYWYAITYEDAPAATVADGSLLAALGTWRYTQGIYRIDPDLQEALTDSELTGDLPGDVLLRLPEWCIYIETPGMFLLGKRLHGLWVHLDSHVVPDKTELKLVFDLDIGPLSFALPIGPWSLIESVAKTLNEAAYRATLADNAPFLRDIDNDARLAEELQPILALIIYICSEEPDMRVSPGARQHIPKFKNTRKGLRLYPADKTTVWRVGFESVGQELRAAKHKRVSSPGNSPRSHIRRGHWHKFWSGSGESKQINCRWLSPIVVRGREADEKTGETLPPQSKSGAIDQG